MLQKAGNTPKKTVLSNILESCILLIFKSNIIQFLNSFYLKKGIAMGTPIAPDYANFFMNLFQTPLLNHFQHFARNTVKQKYEVSH